MKLKITLFILMLVTLRLSSQIFTRTQLNTTLRTPWEIIYGPDEYLWVTDSGGRVSRIHPETGARTVVYSAPDYFHGSPKEQLQACFKPKIGSGTLGMALHPEFMNPATSFIYFVYSYNSTGDTANPATKFKIKRIKWNATTQSIIGDSNIVTGLTTGYDHLGGRLMIIPQIGTNYLFFTIGDNGISETNDPDCYTPQSNNPNNFAQDPTTQNGKIHRFMLDGSIPSDNPLSGNSFYTRGHRNPQGLMYHPLLNKIYSIEHGDRTDDEINVLEKGMNYGWKWVRGYHGDSNYITEDTFIKNYRPYTGIANDGLRPAFYSWCATPQPTDPQYLNWCTPAPSDGIYYGSNGIPEWTNSLLVVTLKNGLNTDQEVYRFKLNPDGSLVQSTGSDPNPDRFFGSDQALNGRLRDITYSNDGKKIYLINNGGNTPDKISVYTVNATSIEENAGSVNFSIQPNPANTFLNLNYHGEILSSSIFNILGMEILSGNSNKTINISELPAGIYYVHVFTENGSGIQKFIKQ